MTTNGDTTRAALYCRVSTDEQGRSGYSIPDQRRMLAEHAERQGWRVVETLVDDGYSRKDPHRPDWRKVYELAEGREIGVVLATKRDRFFRSRLHRLLAEQDLGEMGVRMVALDDTSNKLADAFLDSFAEFEREQIKERTMRGLAQKARSGKVIRSSWKPYGFVFTGDGCGLAVDPGEMRVVVRLFEGLAEGRTGRSITDGFEAEGILPPPDSTAGTRGPSRTYSARTCTVRSAPPRSHQRRRSRWPPRCTRKAATACGPTRRARRAAAGSGTRRGASSSPAKRRSPGPRGST